MKCVWCGEEFTGRKRKYCSMKCCEAAHRKQPRKRYNLTCEKCGTEFTSRHRLVRFCSPLCVGLYSKPRNLVNCPSCGKVFWPWQDGKKARKFCSSKCARKFCSSKCARIEKPKEDRKCNNCGKDFKVKNKGQVRCSNTCGGNRRLDVTTERVHLLWRKGYSIERIARALNASMKVVRNRHYRTAVCSHIEWECPSCGKFMVLRCYKTRPKVFCSYKCQRKEQRSGGEHFDFRRLLSLVKYGDSKLDDVRDLVLGWRALRSARRAIQGSLSKGGTE